MATVGAGRFGQVDLMKGSQYFFTGKGFSKFSIHIICYPGWNGVDDLFDSIGRTRCVNLCEIIHYCASNAVSVIAPAIIIVP